MTYRVITEHALQQWRALLHRFYEPFPVVEHYNLVSSVPQRGHSPAM
ncbi:hypothetical protein [Pseudarthrobacter oxydans]